MTGLLDVCDMTTNLAHWTEYSSNHAGGRRFDSRTEQIFVWINVSGGLLCVVYVFKTILYNIHTYTNHA
jgi:hypothetical protein